MCSFLKSSPIWLSLRVSVPFCRKAGNSYEAASFHSFTKAGIHNPVVEAWWNPCSDGVWNVNICTDRSMLVISTVLSFCHTQLFQLLSVITYPAWVVHWLYLYWWIWGSTLPASDKVDGCVQIPCLFEQTNLVGIKAEVTYLNVWIPFLEW